MRFCARHGFRLIRPAAALAIGAAAFAAWTAAAVPAAIADTPAAGPHVMHGYPAETTAVCADRSSSNAPDPQLACTDHGGIADWFGVGGDVTAPNSPSASTGVLLDGAPPQAASTLAPPAGPLSVQAPAQSTTPSLPSALQPASGPAPAQTSGPRSIIGTPPPANGDRGP